MKTFCFDLDGVICTNTWGNYKEAKPISKSIKKINLLFDEGNNIIIFTSRFMTKYKGDISKVNELGYNFTFNQLKSWNLKFNKLIMGKPSYDMIIDDKSFNYSFDWIKEI